MAKVSESMTVRQLRQRVAVNAFKSWLLGDIHLPGKPQTAAVFKALPIKNDQRGVGVTERTWESWFSEKPAATKVRTAKALDAIASALPREARWAASKQGTFPGGYFEQMIHGGLVSAMLQPTKSKRVRHVLANRVQDYVPVSPLHLHLDALEAIAITNGFRGVTWNELQALAARRILELLSDQWNPRGGSIYSHLPSDLMLAWEAADADQRTALRDFYRRLEPDPFERLLNAAATPNWARIGIEGDVAPQHIYKTLFAMAADSGFLVAGRLSAWSLAFATSALAMYALAWSDRYAVFDPRYISEESIFWTAFRDVLFGREDIHMLRLVPAMERCSAKWDENGRQAFTKTRDTYQAQLFEYNVVPENVTQLVDEATSRHPLVWRPCLYIGQGRGQSLSRH